MNAGWTAEMPRRLGAMIREAREEKNISRVKAAEATQRIGAGLHRVAIARIEDGTQDVTVLQLIALASALDSSWLAWLLKAATDDE